METHRKITCPACGLEVSARVDDGAPVAHLEGGEGFTSCPGSPDYLRHQENLNARRSPEMLPKIIFNEYPRVKYSRPYNY